MKQFKDTLALSMLAFKQGQYNNSAKLFTAAMQMDGLENFISEITGQPPVAALTDDSVPQAENTIAPSIASESSVEFESLSSIVETLAAEFSLSNTLIDDGDFEEESRSSDEELEESTSNCDDDHEEEEDEDESDSEDEDTEEDEAEESTSSTEEPTQSSIGPVKFK